MRVRNAKMFMIFSHEKPIEDVFKVWRRQVKRTENMKVSMASLLDSMRKATLHTYANVKQVRLTTPILEKYSNLRREEFTRVTGGLLRFAPTKAIGLAGNSYESSACRFDGGIEAEIKEKMLAASSTTQGAVNNR